MAGVLKCENFGSPAVTDACKIDECPNALDCPEARVLLARVRREIRWRSARVEQLRAEQEYLSAVHGLGGTSAKTGLTISEAAGRVLRDNAAPLGTREVVRRMLDGGYYRLRPGQTFRELVNSVYPILKLKSETFVRISPGVWGLVADPEPVPPAAETPQGVRS